MTGRQDPWLWPPYRRMRRGVTLGTALLLVSLLAFLPAGWILMAPRDPLLRPDLYTEPAWITLGLCVLLLFIALRISSRARERFEALLLDATSKARENAAKQGINLDIELADTYPPVMLSRHHRVLCAAAPECLLLTTEEVKIELSTGGQQGDGPAYPHVVLRLPNAEPDHLRLAPAASRTSLRQVEILAEKLHDHLDPRQNWDQASGQAIDMAAFIDSMRPKK